MNAMTKLSTILKNISPTFKKNFGAFSANFFQCFLGKILVRSCGLITLPLLTFYFTREEMGVYQLLLGGLGIFVEVATLGTRQYFAVEYFKYSTLYSRLNLVSKNLWVNLKYTSLIFLLALSGLLSFFDKSYFGIFVLFLFQSYLNIFNEMFLTFLQLQMKFTRYNILSFLFALTQMSLVVLAVVVLKFKLAGMALLLFIGEAVFLAFFSYRSRRSLLVVYKMFGLNKVSRSKVIGLLKQSWLFVPSTISFWLLVNIDQWMLGGMTNLDNVGLYAFAGKFPLFFDFLLSSTFIFIYTPVLYEGLKNKFVYVGNRNAMLSILVFIFSGLVYGVSVGLVPYIKVFISENFYASLAYIPPLIFVACTRLASNLLQLTFKYKGQIAFILWTNIFAAILNTILNYLWIPMYGINGCLMATTLSFVCMFVVNLIFHQFLIRAVEQENGVRSAT